MIVKKSTLPREKLDAESLPRPTLSPERPSTPNMAASALSSLHASGTSLENDGPGEGGVLSVDYYDHEGKHHGNMKFKVTPPVHASVKVTAKAGAYDPMRMSDQMQALATRMLQGF